MFVVRQDRKDDEPNNGLRSGFLSRMASNLIIDNQEFLRKPKHTFSKRLVTISIEQNW